ncbi:MAG: protein kinase family protein, partial [Gammaproteobacteria bacterium]|nr:protein kinase family protein [Gammaproteobacteria bacterium]
MQNRNTKQYPTITVYNLKNKPVTLVDYKLPPIGKGGFGTVYVVYDNTVPVALKVQKFQSKHADKIKKKLNQYRKEISIMKALTMAHAENVVTLYGVYGEVLPSDGTTSLPCYKISIAMNYAANGSLAPWLSDFAFPDLLPATRMQIARGITRGVKAMHDANILHCDLKTPNILLDWHFVPMICDFGLSKRIGIDDCSRTVGTTLCMSPATLLSHYSYYDAQQSKEDDIYSLSFLIWCLYADEEFPFTWI